jgi:Serine hydrolase (FSH1)
MPTIYRYSDNAWVAAVRYDLERTGDATFTFIDADFEGEAALEAVDIYDGPFYDWFPFDRQVRLAWAEGILRAHAIVEAAVTELGPFDGILGFSQGATIAGSILLKEALQEKFDTMPFKCAVLIGGPRPFEIWSPGANRVTMKRASGRELGQVLRVPTLHIVGKQDPWYGDCVSMMELCDEEVASLYAYEGAHPLPTSQNINAVMASEIRQLIKTVTR